MPDRKISELPEKPTPALADVIVIVCSATGENRRVTLAALRELLKE